MELFMLDYQAFRVRLRRLLLVSKRLLGDVAADAGVSAVTLTRYLNGSRDPEPETVCRLALSFNVSVDWLLGLPGDWVKLLPDERALLEAYAVADPETRRAAAALLRAAPEALPRDPVPAGCADLPEGAGPR